MIVCSRQCHGNAGREAQKKQRRCYSGKKKRHTLKAQLLMNWETREVIATAFGRGQTHDFSLFKQSATYVHPDTIVLADLGYLGSNKLHAQTCLPVKATKHHPLTHDEKQANRTLARLRLRVEQVIGKLKVFRILSERYRGRRKRFGLRYNLITGIHNFELGLNT